MMADNKEQIQSGTLHLDTDLEQLIERAVSLKKDGNKEFVLYRWGDKEWSAHIGNPSRFVAMLEADAEFSGKGETPVAAVENLISELLGRTDGSEQST